MALNMVKGAAVWSELQRPTPNATLIVGRNEGDKS